MEREQQIEALKKQLEAKKLEYAAVACKQNALKLFLNSGYGALTNQYFRFYDLRLARSITLMGQTCIRGSANYVEKHVPGVENAYTDTDSNFYDVSAIVDQRFPDGWPENAEFLRFVKKLNEKRIDPIITEFFTKLVKNCNGMENHFAMENEVIGDKGLFLGKKKYCIHIVKKDKAEFPDDPKLKTTGIEVVRTSTPEIIRKDLTGALKLFFQVENREKMLEFKSEKRESFKTLKFVDVAFPRGCNNLEKYENVQKSVPIHVRASLVYNRMIKKLKLENKYRLIKEGDKVKFAYIRIPNGVGSNVIACPDNRMPDELSELFEIDYKKQFVKAFEAPLEKVFDAMNWSMNEAVVSLADFFN